MRILASLLLVALVSACTRTDMTSFTDPAYRGVAGFQSVIVTGDGMPLDEREALENTAVGAFSGHGVRAFRGLELLPPTRQMSPEEVAERLVASGAETVLWIGATDKNVDQSYVPPSYVPGNTYATAQTVGSTTYVTAYQDPGYTVGGFTVSKPRAAYSAKLYDLSTGAIIWTADALSRGGGGTNFVDLGKSAAQKAVSQLVKDGLFRSQ